MKLWKRNGQELLSRKCGTDLLPSELARTETLQKDLEHFYGQDWREMIVVPTATLRYAQRLREKSFRTEETERVWRSSPFLVSAARSVQAAVQKQDEQHRADEKQEKDSCWRKPSEPSSLTSRRQRKSELSVLILFTDIFFTDIHLSVAQDAARSGFRSGTRNGIICYFK
ncbi:Heme oxygenase [Bagarius yarrelli]|uniref:Heme oxygenase n=1 Tax=Bagarius yarrelli TaxID=175774 RepID=A0A556TTF4_BAGYA|nr:Heme oxygenase [Bagarius yarrelli]